MEDTNNQNFDDFDDDDFKSEKREEEGKDEEEAAAEGQVEGSESETASKDRGEIQEEGRTGRRLIAIAPGLEC